jgi:DNA-directed RNA polymerase alpha subunit
MNEEQDIELLQKLNTADIEALEDARGVLEIIKKTDPDVYDHMIDDCLILIDKALSISCQDSIDRIADKLGNLITKEELLDHFAQKAIKQGLIREAYSIAEILVAERQEILDKWNVVEFGIEKLKFSVRTFQYLKAENIHTIQQLQQYSENDLLKTPNIGRKSLNEIIERMNYFKYKLKGQE